MSGGIDPMPDGLGNADRSLTGSRHVGQRDVESDGPHDSAEQLQIARIASVVKVLDRLAA